MLKITSKSEGDLPKVLSEKTKSETFNINNSAIIITNLKTLFIRFES